MAEIVKADLYTISELEKILADAKRDYGDIPITVLRLPARRIEVVSDTRYGATVDLGGWNG